VTPDDRTLAREALIRRRLTIEQVTELQKECDSSGRSFGQAAIARRLLGPEEVASMLGSRPGPAERPAPVPAVFQRLLLGTLGILGLLLVVSLFHMIQREEKDRRLAEESIIERAKAEQQARDAALAYQRSRVANREVDARKSLDEARRIMAFAEERLREAPAEPQLHPQLVQATIGFNGYLEVHPDDAPVLVERSRAYELRRDFERALADLDRALEVEKELAPKLDPKLQELRLQVARPKK
jgi:tetratricopeptide (TPR) repeat protein